MVAHSHFFNPELHVASSEMVARVREYDWRSTSLGTIQTWPQSLRMAVGMCLNSRFPMFVWWGPDLINVYNDAYAPILGDKHPSALGRPAREVWPEIWHVVGPQAEAVMTHAEATWNERVPLSMERHGYAEQTYFTWSYSPIFTEAGEVGGVFCTCYEETGRVLAERDRDSLVEQIESERQRLAEAFEQSPSFLAIMKGPTQVFEFVNERFMQLIGRRDVLGRPLRDAVPEVEGQGFFELLDRVYTTGERFVGTGMPIKLQRSADQPLETAFLDFVYQPLRGSDGAVSGVLAHGVDVTDRQVAQNRDRFVLRLEDALRPLSDPAQITATAAQLLGETLQADRCVYAEVLEDQETFVITGDYTRGVPSVVGRYQLAQFGEEYRSLMHADEPYIVRDIDTHRPKLEDLSGYHALGIRALVAVPMHKAGRLVGGMALHQSTSRVWTRADVELLEHVTSRCYESLERARVERTLRESEARFRQLADAMPQIVFAAQPDGHVDYFNRQWYEYTGLAEGSSGYDHWKSVHTAEGLRRVSETWPEAIRTGQPYEIEYRLRRHDGVYRWHLGRALPIRDDSGRIVRWFGTNTDIDDRKRIEEALGQSLEAEQQARSEAEKASRMKDEFLATLSHELRTPLNAILGWAHMMRGEGMGPAELRHGAEVIERNARAQATIIEDLLDMSAIISGKVRLDLKRVDLSSLVLSAVETARPTADAKNIRIVSEIEGLAGVEMSGDANRLQQVLWNLLTNAVKFTPRNGLIRVLVRKTPAHVEVSVVDSGVGIAPDFLPFVFDRFRQADSSTTRQHGGLGLGLSIVKQLVELHGGTVRVESEGRGYGAAFTVTLPTREAHVEKPEQPAERRDAPRIDVPPSDFERIASMRVLVVDDDPDARDLVKRLLENCDATVSTAGSSAEALDLLRGHRFDVLVSDIGMPGEDGHALMEKVRAMSPGTGGDIPAVALTAYARPEDRVKALRSGFQMHAAKPVEPAELIAIVASLRRSSPRVVT